MRGTKGITAALAAGFTAAAVCFAAAAAADENLVELFYTYSRDNMIISYTDENFISADREIQFKTYDGFLALSQTDLDWDGVEELLAIRLKPMADEYKIQKNTVVAEVYRRQDNTLQRVAQYTLADDILYTSECTLDVFAVNNPNGSGQLLCCEARDLESLVADGVSWKFCAAGFDGNSFYEAAADSLSGSSFSDEDMSAAYNAVYTTGLEPYDLVWEPLADQTGVGVICSIDRVIYDRGAVSEFLHSGGTGDMQFGETCFEDYMNPDRENKLSKEFAAQPQEDARPAQQVQAQASDGGGYTFAGDYVIPDSDSRYIAESDLSSLSEKEIMIARNEIYARHGRIFNDPELDAYFRGKSWYQPTVQGIDFTEEYAAGVFNDYETANIGTIVAYERAHNLNGL